MLSSFSAPELFNLVGSIDKTTDIYSVGLILYRIYNGNHGPFEDEKTSAKAADKLRVTGQALPAPMYADYEMTGIILKACAFKPEDRYQTPDELRVELVEYMCLHDRKIIIQCVRILLERFALWVAGGEGVHVLQGH